MEKLLEQTVDHAELPPFLKWAGGKRWLTQGALDFRPLRFKRYIEPFLGSGAVFFHLNPNEAILSDSNNRLVDSYKAIQSNHAAVERHLSAYSNSHNTEHYYLERTKKHRSFARSAAQFIYLNRVCFNGIYRENLKGEFNVPIGTKQSVVLDTDNFSLTAERLANAKLSACDFELTIDLAKEGDFLFVDPPYTTAHNSNGFVKYNQRIFTWDDQVRLHASLTRAIRRGAIVVVTNAAHPSILDLYRGWGVRTLKRRTVISGKSAGRGETEELLISNLPSTTLNALCRMGSS